MNLSTNETLKPLGSNLSRNLSKTTCGSLSSIDDQNPVECNQCSNSDETYEKGRQDMLVHLCETLKKNLGIDLPTDSPNSFIKKLGREHEEGIKLCKASD